MKRAKGIISADFPCCTLEHNVLQAAEMMAEHDWARLP
jgi:CBS domain-containing protein